MIIRSLALLLLTSSLPSLFGCSNPAPPATTAQPTVSQAPMEAATVQYTNQLFPNSSSNYGEQARQLDHDLQTLKSCANDGLVTSSEYEMAHKGALEGVLSTSTNLSLDMLHAELAYLAGMKERGTIKPDEFERLRRHYVANYLHLDEIAVPIAAPPASQPGQQ